MIRFIICFMTVTRILNGLEAGNLQDVNIANNSIAIKGADLLLVCNIANFNNQDAVHIYRSDSRVLSGPLTDVSLTACLPSWCLTHTIERYRFSADSSSLYVNISRLNRKEDQKWWTCVLNNQRKDMYLTVYTVPQYLQIEALPSINHDLAQTAVTLQCHTGCIYPQPSILWFYTESDEIRQNWSTSAVTLSNKTGDCTDSEQVYTSTLSLGRFTTFPGNVEKNVNFTCGIMSFVGLAAPLFASLSFKLQFAVKVTTVTLKDNDNILRSTDEIEATSGVPKTLECATSTSRPAATIIWYIDNTEKQRGTSTYYTFTPVYGDNNARIYCKAFNIQSEINAVSSSKPRLFVKVKVTNVTLYDGTSTPGNNDEVVVTEDQVKNMTCKTGDANPGATIVWYIGDQVKQRGTNSNLFYTFTNNDHGKRIYCKAYNIQPPDEAVSSLSPRLYVRVLARTPTLTNWTQGNPDFFAGEEVTLSCKSTPTRPAVITVWRKGVTTLQNVQDVNSPDSDGLVTVLSQIRFTVQRSDNGTTISCETSVTDQNPPKEQRSIQVWWPPSPPSIPVHSFPWLEGQTGRKLKCNSSDFGNPKSEVVWNTTVGNPETASLNFPQLKGTYDGLNVTCQLSNIYTEKLNTIVRSSSVQLDIQYRPVITFNIDGISRKSIVRNEGQSLTALCTAKGNPTPSVAWEHRTTENYTQLIFTDIDRKDHGSYRCTAKSSSSHYPSYELSREATLNVTVNYAPMVTVEINDTDPTENSSLQIKCVAVGRPNVYTYTSIVQSWEGVNVPNANKPVSGVINIRNAQLRDSGTYTCVVNNGIRDRNQQLNQIGIRSIMVKVSPKVLLEGHQTFVGEIGSSLNITVPFYCFPEIRYVIFRSKNGTEITNSNKYGVHYKRQIVTDRFYGQSVSLDGYIAVLQIHDVEQSDFSSYELLLQNDVGTQKEWILELITKEDKPSKSPVAAIAGGSVGAVLAIAVAILIVIVFVRRRRVQNKEEERSNDRKLENIDTTESSYCDLSSHYESHQYSQVVGETQLHYETLQSSFKDADAPNIYEKLQTQNERTSDSVSTSAQESPVAKSETKIYANMEI